jgi:2-(1,2-epoxy-1,2-dihydrophenyl)acetyl-CoA isomerase
MLMLGGKVTAEEALGCGLANRVAPDGSLDAVVSQTVAKLKEVAPWGLAMTKEMLNRSASLDYSTAIEMEAWTQTMLMTAGDFREFHAGFVGNHPPQFTGR